MTTYICLAYWTQKGIEAVRESPSRLDAVRESWEQEGIVLKDFFMTVGQYDLALVIEAPDDAALAKALLTTASNGAVRTTTLRAFSEAEYRQIVRSI